MQPLKNAEVARLLFNTPKYAGKISTLFYIIDITSKVSIYVLNVIIIRLIVLLNN